MIWQRLVIAFELLSPLHIGFLPNRPGTVVSRTRCYVPGKNIWGAAVSAITPRLYHENLTGQAFRQVGSDIYDGIVFSYFYLSDGENIFTPEYSDGGLTWGGKSDRDFRSQFFGAYVSTELIKDSGKAAQGTLHEIEFIRNRTGKPSSQSQPVILVGTIWIRENTVLADKDLDIRDGSVFVNGQDIFDELVIGGERNYGFGRVRRVLAVNATLDSKIKELWPQDNPQTEIPLTKRPLLAHFRYQPDIPFKGDIEILAGREYQAEGATAFVGAGVHISQNGYYFTPGTRLDIGDKLILGSIDSWGRFYTTNH